MSNGMDDRRKGMEEEYFHRKNQEAIEKLREKIRLAVQAKEAGTSSMKCPRCDGTLKEVMIEHVAIDSCDKCAGTWLDSGELEQLTKTDTASWFRRLWSSKE
ncbi:MAG TPA: zf-TFIIB domain-containing protein [Pyrinomonadaceae bacterium]|nr:zf-TFIIB domain-containing protein [Pyrinomonadaceae bacterium]